MPALLDMYAAHAPWIWVAVAAAILAVEIATGTGWLLWPAAAAGVVAAASAFIGLSGPAALITFALLTIVMTLLGKRFLPRQALVEGLDINDNIARLVGHHGLAAGAFSDRLGRVFIDGKEWAAELDDDGPLADGARIEVTGVHGVRLKVRSATS